MRCRSDALYCLSLNRGRGSMVELELPKLTTRVRFPSPAPALTGHHRFSMVPVLRLGRG